MSAMCFMFFCFKGFKQREETFHGSTNTAHLSATRQVESCACCSERS